MSDIMLSIEEIIEKNCHVVNNTNLVQYTDTYTWIKNDNESFIEGFKRNYPVEYQEEVNCIFDELHPY